jgi:hypothetical protein
VGKQEVLSIFLLLWNWSMSTIPTDLNRASLAGTGVMQICASRKENSLSVGQFSQLICNFWICILNIMSWCNLYYKFQIQSYESYIKVRGRRIASFRTVRELGNYYSVVLVRKRTIPNERPQPVGEVSTNFS